MTAQPCDAAVAAAASAPTEASGVAETPPSQLTLDSTEHATAQTAHPDSTPAPATLRGGSGARRASSPSGEPPRSGIEASQLTALLGALGLGAGVSVHVSTTAKGRLQFEARLPYADLEVARATVEDDLRDLIERIRAAARATGFVLAGEDDS